MAPPISGMKLTFSDNFDSLKLYSRWKPHDQWGNRTLAGNKELQLYVDPKYKGLGINPFSTKDGVLTIKAAKAGGNATKLGGKKYTSGMLSSHGETGFSQKYGYFEMRAQLPAGKGMWPAFWLLADHGKWPPELDVMESIGSRKNYAVQSIHSKKGDKGKTTWTKENLQDGFNTYGMNWTKDSITFYLNGKKTASYATPSDMHSKMHMLLNTAVGGKWPGSPDGTTNWSKTNYKIDYVRVYSADPKAKGAPASDAPTGGNGSRVGPSGTGKGDIVLSDTMNAANLSDSFRVGATAGTYSAAQMAIAGVSSGTSVSVSKDDNDVAVRNNGPWNGIKNASVKSDTVDDVTLRNFVSAEVELDDGSHSVDVSGVKRGEIVTGSGQDKITVSGQSNSDSQNLLTIDAGGGNDTISYKGESDNRVRVSGGTGRDVFSFMAGAHATVTDFKSADDRIQLRGIDPGSVRVRASGDGTLIDMDGGGQIAVAGVFHTAKGLNLAYV